MKQIQIIGDDEFTLGFSITGVRDIINPNGDCNKHVERSLNDKNLGIVVISETSFNELNNDLKEELLASVDPVFVVLSESSDESQIRKMILRSIGVDLLKKEDENDSINNNSN